MPNGSGRKRAGSPSSLVMPRSDAQAWSRGATEGKSQPAVKCRRRSPAVATLGRRDASLRPHAPCASQTEQDLLRSNLNSATSSLPLGHRLHQQRERLFKSLGTGGFASEVPETHHDEIVRRNYQGGLAPGA